MIKNLTALVLSMAILFSYYQLSKKATRDLGYPHNTEQSNYELIPEVKAKTYLFAELGKHGVKLSSELKPGYAVELSGFTAGRWYSDKKLKVDWHLRADSKGEISLRFPKNIFNPEKAYVTLYMTDVDSMIRSSLVKSNQWSAMFANFKGGRWIEIPISTDDIKTGEKTITLEPLIGFGSCVSAIRLAEK